MFNRSEGSYLFDEKGTQYLDLQMWYSAASFGYGNPRLNAALKNQVDILPQLACQYLHKEKILLAAKLARKVESVFGEKGRIHFNVGGASASRTHGGGPQPHKEELGLCLHGRLPRAHAGGIGDHLKLQVPARNLGISPTGELHPLSYCFRCPYG